MLEAHSESRQHLRTYVAGQRAVAQCHLDRPVVAPAATVVEIKELDTTLNAAGVPLNVTPVAKSRLLPRILTVAPALPEVGRVSAKGPGPTMRLKTVPQPAAQ